MSLEYCRLSFVKDSAYRVTTELSSGNIYEIKMEYTADITRELNCNGKIGKKQFDGVNSVFFGKQSVTVELIIDLIGFF